MRLEQPTSGSIKLNGTELTGLDDGALRPLRRDLQMVFQDPYSSLNPRLSVGEIVGEPLIVHKIAGPGGPGPRAAGGRGPRPGRRRPVPGRVLRRAAAAHRHRPGAGAASRGCMILDEPVSALDVSIQASILNLLRDLQRERDLAYLFISHDLAVIRQVADEIAVMHLGLIVEQGPAEAVCEHPAHPYTAALLSAVPVPDPLRKRAPGSGSCCTASCPARSARPRAAASVPGAGRPTNAAPRRSRRCFRSPAPTGWPATIPRYRRLRKGIRARDRLLCLARDRGRGRRPAPARLDRARAIRRPALPVRCHGHRGSRARPAVLAGVSLPLGRPDEAWGWPAYPIELGADLADGVYLAVPLPLGPDGLPEPVQRGTRGREPQGCLPVRPQAARRGRTPERIIWYKLPTATYTAYNQIGGASLYASRPVGQGLDGAGLRRQPAAAGQRGRRRPGDGGRRAGRVPAVVAAADVRALGRPVRDLAGTARLPGQLLHRLRPALRRGPAGRPTGC